MQIESRGTAYGLYSLVTRVCFFVSNITFGFMWDNYDIHMAVTYSVSLSFCAIIGMSILIKNYSNIILAVSRNK